MKKVFIYLLCAFATIGLITGCDGKKDSKKDEKEKKSALEFEVDKESAENFKNEYEQYNDVTYNGVLLSNLDIPVENIIYYTRYDEMLEVLNGTGVVFFGSPKVQASRDIIFTLFDLAKSNNISRIYYMNLEHFENKYQNQGGQIVKTVNEQEGYYEILDKLFSELDEYFIDGIDVGEKRIYAPTIFFVQDGKIIGKYDINTFKDEPAEEKTKKIEQKFNYYMEQIYSGYCTDAC